MFKKIIAIGGTLAIAASLSVIAVAGAAEATHPVVSGTAACDSNGVSTITWRVTGDAGYPDETATIKSAVVTSDGDDDPAQLTSLLEQSVKGTEYIEAVQGDAVAGTGYSLAVAVQWTNHDAGELITQSSEVVTAESCEVPNIEDAAASLTTTTASCLAGAELVLGDVDNFTWGEVTRDGDKYSVTATADHGHSFPAGDGESEDGVSEDGSTMLFEGTLEPQKTGPECTPPPNCIPGSAVSYVYDRGSNSGSIHVENVPSATGELCRGFWVTATSWKYKTDKVWPQTLDQLDYVNGKQKITLPGDYAFQAVMTCGQGDIYASFNEQPVPTQTLAGPSDPYDEFFLHQMGFTGPAPTYFNQTPGCNTVIPVAPDVTKTTECGVAPTVVAKVTTGVDYEVVLDSTTGDYVVTATPQPNYYFAGDDDQVVIFKGNIGVLVDCVERGNASAAFGECTAGVFDDGLSSDLAPSRSATLTFDNSKSTKPVLFQVIGFPEYDTTVAARDTVKVDIANATATGTSFRVMASGKTFDIPIPACDLPPFALVTPRFSVTQPTCTTAGSYTLGSVVGELVWTVNGKSGVASGTYPAPADYSAVTITAAPAVEGDGLDPDWVNPVVLRFAAPAGVCSFDPPTLPLNPTLPLSPPTLPFNSPTLAFTGLTIGAGISLAGGLLFVGLAGLFVARHRRLHG